MKLFVPGFVKTSISAPLWRPLSAEKVFVLIFNCETLSGSGVRLVMPSRELPLTLVPSTWYSVVSCRWRRR